MNFLQYILYSSAGTAVSWLAYVMVFRRSADFRGQRFFLIVTLLASMLVPFSNYRIHAELPVSRDTKTEISRSETVSAPAPAEYEPVVIFKDSKVENPGLFSRLPDPALISITVTILLLMRLLLHSGQMIFLFLTGNISRDGRFVIIRNRRLKTSFSFFRWLFIPPSLKETEEEEQILRHEKIHASQMHSADLLLSEIAIAVMWFNPLVWLMRSSLRLVHEYLADEGVLVSGSDRLGYQALLINQVAEGNIVRMSSGFNSQIKKRMKMMNKQVFSRGSAYRILALIPVILILFFGIACIKGKDESKTVTAVALTKMNVLYLGVENPVVVAVSGYEPSDLTVSIDNGKVAGEKGEYRISPSKTGIAEITVSAGGKEVQKLQYRVKFVPDPVAGVETGPQNWNTGGEISKSELLKAGGITALLQNFDFDLKFTVSSFVLSATVPNSMTIIEEISKTDRFTDKQVELIRSLKKFQKLTVENVMATGPDGAQRKLNSLVFNISGE